MQSFLNLENLTSLNVSLVENYISDLGAEYISDYFKLSSELRYLSLNLEEN